MGKKMGAEKKRSPSSTAKRGTLEEFLISAERNPEKDRRSLLFWAPRDRDLTARMEIVSWMLGHGADPARVGSEERISALHVVFEEREHDFVGEARLLQCFLDGSADINLKAPKWDVSIRTIVDEMIAPDTEVAPLYDVLFSYPGIGWDMIVGKAFGEPVSLRKSVELSAKQHPELHQRMRDYLESGSSFRPVSD